MEQLSNYKNPLIVASLVTMTCIALSSYVFFCNDDQVNLVVVPTEKSVMPEPSISPSIETVSAFPETKVGTGSCIFIDQSPFVQTHSMIKKNDATSLGYVVDLDASITTGTLVSVCKINGHDIQLIKESPYSESESNWTLAVKDQSATSGWKLVEFRNTLQSDFPGCELRQIYHQDDGRYVAVTCSQRIEMGNIGRREDYFLADTEKKTVKKYASCTSNDLNVIFNIPSLRDGFPLKDDIQTMHCSIVTDGFVRSE